MYKFPTRPILLETARSVSDSSTEGTPSEETGEFSKKVRWTACTIDNEHLGRRSSKGTLYPASQSQQDSSYDEEEDEESIEDRMEVDLPASQDRFQKQRSDDHDTSTSMQAFTFGNAKHAQS